MRVLWLAWKDINHPKWGGAEVVLTELMERQAQEGHQLTLLTSRYPGAAARERLPNGIEVIRVGSNRYTHPTQALLYYLRHLRGKFDLIVETVNTAPYFSLLFKGKSRGVALYHQLARDIWFFESKPPISHLGYYVVEPLSTWLLGRAKARLITVSNSTKQDLLRYGWREEKVHIISEGIHIEPISQLDGIAKYDHPTMICFGGIRSMKRTLDQIIAFEVAKKKIPSLQFKLAGDAPGEYGITTLKRIKDSPYAKDIEYLGRISKAEKIALMQRAHLIAHTSVKEGWGLVVTEAASQGTPAVVYDADGLRDSVRHGRTGLVTAPDPAHLAEAIVNLLTNHTLYEKLRRNAWEWSKEITFERSYEDFKYALGEATT